MPYESDEVTRLIVDTYYKKAFEPMLRSEGDLFPYSPLYLIPFARVAISGCVGQQVWAKLSVIV